MKTAWSIPVLLLWLLVTSCQSGSDSPSATDEVFQNEVFTSRIGNEQVYGVRMRFYEDRSKKQRYLVQLSADAEVWIDTIEINVPAQDTLEYELVFSESRVQKDDLVEVKIKKLALEQ